MPATADFRAAFCVLGLLSKVPDPATRQHICRKWTTASFHAETVENSDEFREIQTLITAAGVLNVPPQDVPQFYDTLQAGKTSALKLAKKL